MEVRLKVVQGKPLGKQFTIPTDRFVIGRANDCHLKPNSDLVDLHQCAIVSEGGQVRVEHLGSANGTHINGVAVGEAMAVKSGDLLQVGPLVFAFDLVGAAVQSSPESKQSAKTSATPDDAVPAAAAKSVPAPVDTDRDNAAGATVESETALPKKTAEPSQASSEALADSILSETDDLSTPLEESAVAEEPVAPKVKEEDPVLDTVTKAPETREPTANPSAKAEPIREPVAKTESDQASLSKDEASATGAVAGEGEDVMDWLMDSAEPVSTGSDTGGETSAEDATQEDANGQNDPSGGKSKKQSSTEKTSSVAADILRRWTQGGGQQDS